MSMPKHSHTHAEYSFTIISRVYWPCLHTFTRNESNIHEQGLLKCRSGWLVSLPKVKQAANSLHWNTIILVISLLILGTWIKPQIETLNGVGLVEHAISLLFGIWCRVRAFCNTCMYGISKSFSSHAYPDNSCRTFPGSWPTINFKTSLWHR